MDTFTIIAICITVVVLLLIFTTKSNPTSTEKFNTHNKRHNGHNGHNGHRTHRKHGGRDAREENVDDIINDVVSWDDSVSNNSSIKLEKRQVNPHFIDIQFHNDYRDVITSINNIIPAKKQLFNIANRPLNYSEPPVGEVKNMTRDFLGVLNEDIKTEVPNCRNPNTGWDEAIPDPTIKSGWEKVQESLGLAPSLYNKPACKGCVKLIAITRVQKYETEDEIKYACEVVVQKANVKDQMVLKISFLQDKRPIHDENNFFTTKNIEMNIIVENIFTVGYLSRHNGEYKLRYDKDEQKFYDYQKLEKNDMVDPKCVQKILMSKYKQRSNEMEQRNSLLDEEGQDFHRTLPNIYDYSNIKATQTIFDDMNFKRKFV